jgi:hypothetical protein
VAISAGVANFVQQIPPGMTIDWSYWDQFKQPEAAKVKSAPMAKIEDQSVQSGPNNGLLADAGSEAEDEVVDTPHVYDPASMKGTRAEIEGQFKTGDRRQDAKKWRAAHIAAAKKKWGYGTAEYNKIEYLKQRNKIAHRHRIMLDAGAKTLKDGTVIGGSGPITTPHVYDPETMKGTQKEVANKFKTGTDRQDAKTWRANQMAAAKKKFGGDSMTKDQKTAYLKQRDKIANRHRIMVGAGEKKLKDGTVIGKDPTA